MPVSAHVPYDDRNVFARILRGELPCRKVLEDEFALAFHDINPQAPVHVLVIPRRPCVSLADFSVQASEAEMTGFFRAVGAVARQLGLEEPGYRVIANAGGDAGQEVPHFHVHILAGRAFGHRLVPAPADHPAGSTR